MNVLREIRVPQESVNDETVNVMRTFFAHGDRVTASDVVIELETSKINISLSAEVDGFVHYLCKEGDEVGINALVVVIGEAFVEGGVQTTQLPVETPSAASPQMAMPQATEPPTASTPVVKVARVALKFDGEPAFSARALELIETHGLSQNAFTGYDLVASEDVLALVNSIHKTNNPVAAFLPALPSVEMEDSTVTRKKISKSKKREIDYLQQVQQAGLNSMVNIEVDTRGILAATAPHSKYFKHSLLPVILYEASRLLLKYPALNAYYHQEEIRFYNDVNVGVAIDIDEGLKTVSIRNTVALGMCELEETLFSLSNKYVDRTLTPFDMADITFTVTDLSGEGILFFSPLINHHNSAILGISAAKPNGAMVLSLTFDHRVTEGKAASGFLRELKERMEDYRNRLGASSPDLRCSQCRKPLKEDLSGFGFLKIVNKTGAESLLCQTCFKGL
jgi:pyruvate/2-oxoglutarate dehydrogenase complex dihydrolipoamide acyltransferase (E2) component